MYVNSDSPVQFDGFIRLWDVNRLAVMGKNRAADWAKSNCRGK